MAEIIEDIKEYTNVTKKYLDVKVEVIKAKAKIAASEVASSFAIWAMVGIVAGGALLILSFGLAESLGEKLGDKAMGLYIVGAAYLLIAVLILIAGRAFLKRKIQNEIIRKLDEKL